MLLLLPTPKLGLLGMLGPLCLQSFPRSCWALSHCSSHRWPSSILTSVSYELWLPHSRKDWSTFSGCYFSEWCYCLSTCKVRPSDIIPDIPSHQNQHHLLSPQLVHCVACGFSSQISLESVNFFLTPLPSLARHPCGAPHESVFYCWFACYLGLNLHLSLWSWQGLQSPKTH